MLTLFIQMPMTRLVGLVLDALTNCLPRVFHGSLGA